MEPIMAGFAWLRTFLSATFIGLFLGAILFHYIRNYIGIGLMIIFTMTGMFIGYKWAEYVRKKYGSIWFISRNRATPELDHTLEEHKNEN